MFIDSHCHLNYKGLVEDQQAVLDRARAAGVVRMLNISTRASEWDEVIGLAEQENDVMASVGIHPHEADLHPDIHADRLVEKAAHPRVIGIGETGLDYYYDHSDRERQRQSFRAHADTLLILDEEMGKGRFPALIHCFTASRGFADRVLELGLYISLSGIVTFKNARELQETARSIPLDRLLIETDAPFLAPVPHRGRTCEPAFVADTAAFLAGLRDEPIERLAEATSANFRHLFAKAA